MLTDDALTFDIFLIIPTYNSMYVGIDIVQGNEMGHRN